MASFAELDENNIVLRVLVVDNEQEHRGEDFLANDLGLGGRWIQTSYNTTGGVHRLGGTPFRKNHAGTGFSYDESRDAFIPPKPFPSWLLDEDKCIWYSPKPRPRDYEIIYVWNENEQDWKAEL
jgi:hypothetical protein